MNSDTPIGAISGRLPHLGLLRFAGLDRCGFLQGQVSNDTRELAAGRPLLAAYANPQGRVSAVIHLLPHGDCVIGIVPKDVLMPTLERMRRFVLRSKITIEDASGELSVAGVHGEAALRAAGLPVPDAASAYRATPDVGVGIVGADTGRFWLIAAPAKLAALGLGGDGAEAERIERDWRLADIRAGRPQIYAPTSEMFVAQMLNLDLVGGISFSKGCYTGQEIIARAQHLGRIKRRMLRLALAGEGVSIGAAIRLVDGRTGRVTELARTGGGFEALAVVNLAAADGGPDDGPGGAGTAGAAATELPLPYRL